jgi:hypothetical protein
MVDLGRDDVWGCELNLIDSAQDPVAAFCVYTNKTSCSVATKNEGPCCTG